MTEARRFELYCGPFVFDVDWRQAAKPRAVNVPFVSFYLKRDGEAMNPSYPRARFEIAEPVAALTAPPAAFAENAENWRAWTTPEGRHVFQVWSGETRDYSIEALISADFLSTRILCARAHPGRAKFSVLIAEITKWVAAHLAFGRGGFLFHGAAVQRISDGAVVLGFGPSGAGKSTLSKFFAGDRRYRVLTDETCMILCEDGQYRVYGTPWPGMLNKSINAGGPLAGFFSLEKTERHAVRDLPPAEAAVRLAREIFLPPWSEAVVSTALEAAAKLAAAVPPRALGFAKNKSVVEFLDARVRLVTENNRETTDAREPARTEEIRGAHRHEGGLEPGPGPFERM